MESSTTRARGKSMTRGTIYKKTWIYCTQHGQLVTENGSDRYCAKGTPGCRTTNREKFEYCFVRDGKRIRASFPSYAETQSAMVAKQEELARPAPAPDAPTLNLYADDWLTRVASSIEPRTLSSYAGLLKNHIRPEFGASPLNTITRADVKDLLAKKRASGLSKDTVRLVRATVSAIYADAIDRGVVGANPAVKLGKSKQPDSISQAERREKIRVMTPEQLATFLSTAAGDRLSLLWLTLSDCGLRPG